MAQKRENKISMIRRKNRRMWLMLPGVFVAVFLFSFLVAKYKNNDTVDAANLGAFDPGYIISDYQMSNYNSMSEAEIQSFLKQKGNCNDTRTYLADYYTSYSYHIKDGHFVCLADETFGEGTAYGDSAPKGVSAAHIIWQAAQDYRINPQVLIVLLQKEQGLITDSWPNNIQYRSATGYGCPDTAACDAKYYGFKNQVRQAAAMFRAVLDGGWTNYPLGNNYIQYNPNSSCGGSWVNIRSLATSALYRYTPYQPNASALAAGYGSGDSCGAYGNRNFYLFFEDWFGGITKEDSLLGKYRNMVIPRILYVRQGSRYIVPNTGQTGYRSFSSFEYFNSLSYKGDKLCLSIGFDRNCYMYDDLEELNVGDTEGVVVPRMLIVGKNTKYLDTVTNVFGGELSKGQKKIFNYKVYVNGQLCLKESIDSQCVLYQDLEELPSTSFETMDVPRKLYINSKAKVVNIKTGIERSVVAESEAYFSKKTYFMGNLCLYHNGLKDNECMYYSELSEVSVYTPMDVPRYLFINDEAKEYNAGKNSKVATSLIKRYFVEKAMIDGRLCLRAVDDKKQGLDRCVYYYNGLSEI